MKCPATPTEQRPRVRPSEQGFNGSHKETHARDWAVKVLSRGERLGGAFKALGEIATGLLEIWMAGRWGRKPDSGSEGCDGRLLPV